MPAKQACPTARPGPAAWSQALGALSGPLLAAVALGLLLFGLFSFVEARYWRINDPDVAARLKGAVRG